MYIFRLGVIAFLLSETVISGFTTGSNNIFVKLIQNIPTYFHSKIGGAFHVLTSQLKEIFGLRIKPVHGNFKLMKVCQACRKP
jgi:solute carrier family 26 protein